MPASDEEKSLLEFVHTMEIASRIINNAPDRHHTVETWETRMVVHRGLKTLLLQAKELLHEKQQER